MAQDPFPARGPDGQEPDGSAPPPVGGSGPQDGAPWPEDDWDGEAALDAQADAGLYEIPPGDDGDCVFVCLPPEEEDLAGFADGGAAQAMGPGPVLASLVHAAVGPDGKALARLSEDELLGVLAAARRLESRAAWAQMA